MHKDVKIGLIGLGNMGGAYADWLLAGEINHCKLVAVCSKDPGEFAKAPGIKAYEDSAALIRSGEVDAVIVTTPHYSHTTIGIDALEQGLHVIVDKPISVHKKDCERLIAAYKGPGKGQIFAAMFNQRTDPRYIKLKRLIDQGELGRIQRMSWVITDWFRTDRYYAMGGWRATWEGEGGGVLLNQCPHNLDLWQWFFGMPSRVQAHCHLGKYHNIEVEDEVTAYLEYEGGATGTFVTSTGEAPGTNRLEVAGDRGRVVVDGDRFHFTRNEISASEWKQTEATGFMPPDLWEIDIPFDGFGAQHQGVLQNFVDTIRGETTLIAPATEGIHSVELANAMLYSSMTDKTVSLPLDGDAFAAMLAGLIENSTFKKGEVVKADIIDMKKTF